MKLSNENNDITLLKCSSTYLAPIEEANLATIPNMRDTFGVNVCLSVHTPGITLPIVAVALGAKVIEKHFILDKSIGGPDAAFSLDVDEFSAMEKAIRETEKAIGKVNYELTDKAKDGKRFGRSLFVVKDIKAGEAFKEENIRSIRPGYGLHPKHYHNIIGKKAKISINSGTPLKWNYI